MVFCGFVFFCFRYSLNLVIFFCRFMCMFMFIFSVFSVIAYLDLICYRNPIAIRQDKINGETYK